MPKFLDLDAVNWARRQLHASCKSLLADFLILKREGLVPGTPVLITSVSTADSAKRLLHIRGTEKRQYFYNPFANVSPWRHNEYPRSGTYTTIERSQPLHKLFDVKRAAEGIEVSLKEDYEDQLQATFRTKRSNPVQISSAAFAVWCSRYDEIPDGLIDTDLIDRVFAEYNLTQPEIDQLFVAGPTRSGLFQTSPLVEEDLARQLLAESPPVHPTAEGSETEKANPADDALPEDLVEFLRGTLLLPTSLLRQLVTLMRLGKHIILTGPPGTGKTTLVARLAEASERGAEKYDLPSSKGTIFTTATADWSTFDTMGGYVPRPSGGALQFNEGLLLEAIRSDRWVVIDELNRADVDKAFGQFFTLLSGHDVRTPFWADKEPVQLEYDPNTPASCLVPGTATYKLGGDWRLLATMNSFDRNLLFQLSAAFLRRFAVIHVGIPPANEMKEWLAQRDLASEDLASLSSIIDLVTTIRPLGPAIWSDFADYLVVRSSDFEPEGNAAFLEALSAFVLPQMDGLDAEALDRFRRGLLEILTDTDDDKEIERLFADIF